MRSLRLVVALGILTSTWVHKGAAAAPSAEGMLFDSTDPQNAFDTRRPAGRVGSAARFSDKRDGGDAVFRNLVVTGTVGIGSDKSVSETTKLDVSQSSTEREAVGVHGRITSENPGADSAAVRGTNHSKSEMGVGVYGEQMGGGYGVYGITPDGHGVHGASIRGYGVYGSSANIGIYGIGATCGLRGVSQSDRGTGVCGDSVSGIGVWGTSATGDGVWGDSDSGYGVWGASQSSDGVRGDSASRAGVRGGSKTGPGVHGQSASGNGVHGASNTGSGVYGTSSASIQYTSAAAVRGAHTSYFGYGVGVWGSVDSPHGGTGVRGTAAGGTGVAGESASGIAVYAVSESGVGVLASTTTGHGVSGYSRSGVGVQGRSYDGKAGYFVGNVDITGKLTAASKFFMIDHPLDPANKYLYHSSVESPEMKNVYDGIVELDAQGAAWVTMPAWFDALNRDCRYQLTSIGRPAPDLYIAEEMSNRRFQIAGGVAGMKVSWQVTGIRRDAFARAHPMPVEEEKPADERGRYLHPEAFGQPRERGIGLLQGPPNQPALGVKRVNQP